MTQPHDGSDLLEPRSTTRRLLRRTIRQQQRVLSDPLEHHASVARALHERAVTLGTETPSMSSATFDLTRILRGVAEQLHLAQVEHDQMRVDVAELAELLGCGPRTAQASITWRGKRPDLVELLRRFDIGEWIAFAPGAHSGRQPYLHTDETLRELAPGVAAAIRRTEPGTERFASQHLSPRVLAFADAVLVESVWDVLAAPDLAPLVNVLRTSWLTSRDAHTELCRSIAATLGDAGIQMRVIESTARRQSTRTLETVAARAEVQKASARLIAEQVADAQDSVRIYREELERFHDPRALGR